MDNALKKSCVPYMQIYLYIGQTSNLCRVTAYYIITEIIVISSKSAFLLH